MTRKVLEDGCWCLATCMLIPAVFCFFGFATYICGFQEIPPEEYTQIHTMVKEFPSLEPMVHDAMEDGHINHHEAWDIQDAHGLAAKRKYTP